MARELPKDLKKGELVLVRPYRKCSFMVLAEFQEPSPEGNDAFYARKAEILYPQTEKKDHILPHADRDFEKANASEPDIKGGVIGYNTFKDVCEVKLFPHRESRFWRGIDNIIQALWESTGYESHVASLEHMQEEKEEAEEREESLRDPQTLRDISRHYNEI
jgi:hypothetical protein